jgi:putative ATPase
MYEPLASRMRPRNLDDFAGQEKLVGENGSLRMMFDGGELGSMVFWGPPGCGKTTLAQMLAERSDLNFKPFSAVLSGIKEVREAMQQAKSDREQSQRPTLVFVDEIHRFNKAQQDAFLPFVEAGDIVLVGATTENPSFEIIGPLLSRLTVHILEPLSEEDIVSLLRTTLSDAERGLGARRLEASDEQLQMIANVASGDARRAYTIIEAAARQCDVGVALTDGNLQKVLAGRALLYDKDGQKHYDLISALHKSIRSSDPDAALYWLVRMLRSGEDPMFLARRLVRMASEDIGLADPNALRLALAAKDSMHFLGSPEGELALAEITIYLAVAPKSNAVYKAFNEVNKLVQNGVAHDVPLQLRNAHTKLMKNKGWGQGHDYAHDHPNAIVAMDCLPDALVGSKFYNPTNYGIEERITKRLELIARLKASAKES